VLETHSDWFLRPELSDMRYRLLVVRVVTIGASRSSAPDMSGIVTRPASVVTVRRES
jgi:hypothetical protein